MLYYIFFFCFTERKSNEQAFINLNDFAQKLGIPGITKQTICNIPNPNPQSPIPIDENKI
jgi:hypothetical protein